MKKLKLLIPITALFASPWMHKIIYNNFLLAWPEMDHSVAHIIGGIGALLALGITALMTLDL